MRTESVMSIRKWSPLNEMDTIMRDMDRIWSEIFPVRMSPGRTPETAIEKKESKVAAPALDMIDSRDKILVKVEMPGVKKSDIVITIDDDTLNIKAEVETKKEDKNEDYLYMERNYSSFARSISLPTKIEEGKISASLKDGILEITLPKAEEVKPKKIKVEVK